MIIARLTQERDEAEQREKLATELVESAEYERGVLLRRIQATLAQIEAFQHCYRAMNTSHLDDLVKTLTGETEVAPPVDKRRTADLLAGVNVDLPQDEW